MSMHRHATISAWQREEDGSYKAEIDGWELGVHWRPESKDGARGFHFTARKGDAKPHRSAELHEEIELAMVAAEEHAAAENAAADKPTEAAPHHG